MTVLTERIWRYINAERADDILRKYYAGKYTGALFDTAPQLMSPDPDRFTAHDMAAVATLSVPLSGRAVCGLIDREEQLYDRLQEIPVGLALEHATDEDLAPLFKLQDALQLVPDIGHVTRSKLLAHKRPLLVPIRDQHVLRGLVGRDHGPFTVPLRDALASDPAIVEALRRLRNQAGVPEISPLRVLDVVVWMAEHGDAQVRNEPVSESVDSESI